MVKVKCIIGTVQRMKAAGGTINTMVKADGSTKIQQTFMTETGQI